MTVFESPQPRRFAVRTMRGMASCRSDMGSKSGGFMWGRSATVPVCTAYSTRSAGTARPKSIQRRRRFTVVDDAGTHPGDGIDIEGREANGAVAKHGVQSAGMGGAEVTTPGVVGWIARLADDYCSLVLITHRRKVPAKDALIPASIVPAFVIAAVQTLARQGQALFGGHNAIRSAVGGLGCAAPGSFGWPNDVALAARYVAIVIVRPFVSSRRHADRRRRNIAPILVHFALVKARASRVVAAAELSSRVARRLAARRAIVRFDQRSGDGILAVVISRSPVLNRRQIESRETIHRLLLDVGQHMKPLTPASGAGRIAASRPAFVRAHRLVIDHSRQARIAVEGSRGNVTLGTFVIHKSQADLLEVIRTLHAPRGFAGGLHGRQQQRHERADDRNHD